MSANYAIVVELFPDTQHPFFTKHPSGLNINVSCGIDAVQPQQTVTGRFGSRYTMGNNHQIVSVIEDSILDAVITNDESLFVWADMMGKAAFTSNQIVDPELARGRLAIPFSKATRRAAQAQPSAPHEYVFRVGVTASVIQWLVTEMIDNASDGASNEMRDLNRRADQLEQAADARFPDYVMSEGVEMTPWRESLLELSSGNILPQRNITEIVNSGDWGRFQSGLVQPGPANASSPMGQAYNAVRSHRRRAQTILQDLGRPASSEGWSQWAGNAATNNDYPNDWELKHRIASAWGHRCRLGNYDWVVANDDLSNLHYGYAGNAAEFSEWEMTEIANVGSLARTGKPDDQKDIDMMIDGRELWDRHGLNINTGHIRQIINNNSLIKVRQ